MKIAVPGRTFTTLDGPIAVILTDQDRANIARMPAEATIYAQTQVDADLEAVDKWLDLLKQADDPQCDLTVETSLDELGNAPPRFRVSLEECKRRQELFAARYAAPAAPQGG